MPRALHALVAICAGIGVLLALAVAALDLGPQPTGVPGLFGPSAPGLAGAGGRLADFISYFTTLSNLLVAATFGVLAVRGTDRGRWFRAVFFAGLLMILITGVVYGVLFGGEVERSGVDVLANLFVHYVTPIVALVVWALIGPFGWIDLRFIPRIVAIPILWTIATLARGAVVGEYPYDFLNVVALGYGRVLVNILAVVALAALLCTVFVVVDRLRRRRVAV